MEWFIVIKLFVATISWLCFMWSWVVHKNTHETVGWGILMLLGFMGLS